MRSSAPLVFETGSKMKGAKVESPSGEKLGDIKDLIIDRGSGKVTHLVMNGKKTVVVPYSAFGWNNADKKATLNATDDEIKNWPEFDKKEWAEGPKTEGSLMTRVAPEYYESANAPWPAEAKADNTSDVKGTVKSTSRRMVDGREEMVITVTPAQGTEQEIIVGPSWYSAGNANYYRGEPVDITVFRTTRNGQDVMIARSARVNGQDVTYYNTEGRAAWWPSSSARKERQAKALSSPLILYTDIDGKDVYARDDKCGHVRDVVFECTTGRAAFLSIDPDQAFLGIGDQNRLVPFTLMTSSTDGKVHIDATKQMITSAPTTPKDMATLSSDTDYKRIYAAYDVQPQRFEHAPRR
jgi:sporulation protein YlmC with PRC-barrel domain